MNKDLKNIDKLFLNNLHGLQDTPPIHIWDEIEQALDSAPLPARKPTQTGKKYLAAALLLLIAGSTMFLIWNSSHTNNNATAGIITKTIAEPHSKTASFTTQKQDQETNQISLTSKDEPEKQEAVNNELAPIAIDAISGDIPPSGKQAVAATIPTVITNTAGTQQPVAPLTIQHTEEYALSSIAATNKINTTSTKKLLRSRFSLAVFFAPDITTRNLEQNKNGTLDADKDEILRTEKSKVLDFTIGTRIEYALNKHFSLQSGISFSSNTIDISPKTIYAGYDVDGTVKYRYNCSSGYAFFNPKTAAAPLVVGDSTEALSSTTVLHYVNIPIAVKYNYSIGRRLNLFAQAGITARFITKHSIAAVYAIGATKENTTGLIQGLKTSYFNGVIGLGADYSIGHRLAITVFPTFNFATTAINRNSPVKAYPNTFSIASGIKINF